MKNFMRLYLMLLFVGVACACASNTDVWRQSLRYPLDTGADAWRDRVKREF